MKKRPELFFLVIALWSLIDVKSSDVLTCPQGNQVLLDNTNVDVTLIEPQGANNVEFFHFLKNERQQRLESFQASISHRFGRTSLTMMQAINTVDGLKCLSRPFTSIEEFAAQPVMYLRSPSENILLATVLSPRLIDTWRDQHHDNNTISITENVVRVTVMIAESYSERPPNAILFWGDEHDSCGSDLPRQLEVKGMFSERKILLLLVTPLKATRNLWTKAFSQKTALLYPPLEEAPEPSSPHLDTDVMGAFVHQRVVDLLCSSYGQFGAFPRPKDRDVQHTVARPTTTATAILPKDIEVANLVPSETFASVDVIHHISSSAQPWLFLSLAMTVLLATGIDL